MKRRDTNIGRAPGYELLALINQNKPYLFKSFRNKTGSDFTAIKRTGSVRNSRNNFAKKKQQQRYVFFSLCPESKKENLLPKDIFLATLNWEAFTFTTIFVQQCVLV